jgi:DNA polymerase-3 subunit delta
VILKSYIIEQNINQLNDYQGVLFYGVNDGMKNDIKTELKNVNKNVEVINFFESDIIKNKNILYDNLINESLFNEKKIIIIQAASDKILPEINEFIEKNNYKIKIYIFSDLLEKKSKLRNLFEKEKNLGVLPCYQDNERTLVNYVTKKLNGYVGLTGEIINLLISNSSSDRSIIKNEIEKIKSFFENKKIDKNEILEVLNIKNNTGFDEVRDNALMGNKDKINKLLSQMDILNEDSLIHLNNLNYRVLKLIEIQTINEKFNNHEKTLENLKPQIFWKDKATYLQQLKKWDLLKLNEIATKVEEVEILIKKNSQIRGDVLIKDLIIKFSQEASTSF